MQVSLWYSLVAIISSLSDWASQHWSTDRPEHLVSTRERDRRMHLQQRRVLGDRGVREVPVELDRQLEHAHVRVPVGILLSVSGIDMPDILQLDGMAGELQCHACQRVSDDIGAARPRGFADSDAS